MKGGQRQQSGSSPQKNGLHKASSERKLPKNTSALKKSVSGRLLPNVIPSLETVTQPPTANNSPNRFSRKFSFPSNDRWSLKLPPIRPRLGSEATTLSVHRPRKLSKKDDAPVSDQGVEIIHHYLETQVGSVQSHPKPHNQDSFFYTENLEPVYTVMGVCDGHGQRGHFVSAFVATYLPTAILSVITRSHTQRNWESILIDSFKQCSDSLMCQQFDSTCSGCTCVCLVFADGRLHCANLGDSRAVLGRKSGQTAEAVPLSRDHKPEVEEEHRRILGCGGRVEPVLSSTGEAIGPLRVWYKNENIPGLAMTRVMGDAVASRVGVISIPGNSYTEIRSFDLTPDDQFLLVASDGIWDFISSQEAINLVHGLMETGQELRCLKVLTETARKRWNEEEGCVDDITIVMVTFGKKDRNVQE